MLKYSIIALLCLGLAQANAASPAPLPDQFGKPISLDDFAGDPVLVIVTSERQLSLIQRWEKALRKPVPQLISMRVANLTSEPKPTIEQVAKKLQKHAPPGGRVAIDQDNHWATDYQLDTKEPCVLLFDERHQLVATFRGKPRKQLTEEVVTALAPYFPAPIASGGDK